MVKKKINNLIVFILYYFLFLGLLFLASPLTSQAEERPSHKRSSSELLSTYEEELAQVESYLQSIQYLSASFIQQSQDGNLAEGKFYLSRPGKMRLEYDKEPPVLIIVNGKILAYRDIDLEETSYLPTSSTPASFLTQKNISFKAKDLEVLKIAKGDNNIKITLRKKDKKEMGEFSLIFRLKPLTFLKMEVKDNLDQITTIILTNSKFGQKINDQLFIIKDSK